MLEIKKTIKIAKNFLWRDFIAGNYNVLIFAILVSITSVISIQFLTNKVEFSIAQDGRASIASDLRITSTRKIDSLFMEKAKSLGIEAGRGVQFPSMVFRARLAWHFLRLFCSRQIHFCVWWCRRLMGKI